MPTLYIASSNPGKLRDFAAAASAFETDIAPLPGLDRIPSPPENEPDFDGNARAKAIAYSLAAPGLLVIADDSGLEVDALGGAPGVRSARYAIDAGHAIDQADAANNALLLREMASIPDSQRTARYRCVLALARNGAVLLAAEGAIEGRIALHPQGTGGFGYDPLFYLPALGKTMAEIDLATKASLSHRGRALHALLEHLIGLQLR